MGLGFIAAFGMCIPLTLSLVHYTGEGKMLCRHVTRKWDEEA